MKLEKSYGFWESPITAASLARGGAVIESKLAFLGREIFFVERRPERSDKQAKEVLTAIDLDSGKARDVLAEEYGMRTAVHEYGGAAFDVTQNGVIFSESQTRDVMFYNGKNCRVLLSGEEGRQRCGDFCYDALRHRWLAVRERHASEGAVINELCFIGLDGEHAILTSGADFYASPCVSADGKRCAWLQWHLPYMAWDRAELWQADITTDGRVSNSRKIAGGEAGRSCFQPQYDSAGNLFFICDNKDGFWQLHCLSAEGALKDYPLQDDGAWVECGLPLWQLGMRVYDFLGDNKILLSGCRLGNWGLYVLDVSDGEWVKSASDYCAFDGLRCYGGKGYFLASHGRRPQELVEWSDGHEQIFRRASEDAIDEAYISEARAISFGEGEGRAYGFYYAPLNGDYCGFADSKPPLIVRCHGGPTAATHGGYSGKIQFWTSRGFAVCDVNYRGSTGYGRAFRERLYGQWGLYDAEDCVAAADYLAARGLVDRERLIIAGSSAGGFTVLCALAFHDCFRAACSIYGIGDLCSLAEDTHKFESGYLDMLVASYESERNIYEERSPLNSAASISCPVLFLQGDEDRVVPSNQMFMMVEALRGNGIDCEYILFEGEGHGFRDVVNIERAYGAELGFYQKIFNDS